MKLLLKTILDLQGYQTEIFENLQNFQNIPNPPAIIILDAGSCENLKGLEICKLIRENPIFSKSKIIVTSIFHDKELVLNCGADLYMPKPYELSSLVKWVKIFIDEVNYG